jgi:AraC family transcriptional regulator
MSKATPKSIEKLSSSPPVPQVLLTSSGRNWRDLSANLLHVPRGLLHDQGSEMHRLGIHFSPPVTADYYCDGKHLHGVQKPGDIYIIPAGVGGSWEDDADCRTLQLSLHPSLFLQVAAELGRKASESELLPRFQVRDTRIEALGWAVKAALEDDNPSDSIYIDFLARALAVRLIETASDHPAPPESHRMPVLSARRLRILTEFIESNLDQSLHLADLARIAGLSITLLKTLFRNSTGISVHQYIIRRRVECARSLLATTDMPISEVAAAAGFSHQSHMASTIRRLIGQTPGEIVRQASDFRPNLHKSA